MRNWMAAGLFGLILGGAGGCVAGQMTETAEAEPLATPKAYMIILGDVYDRPAFMAGYASKMAPLYEKYGGRYLAVGANAEVLEGTRPFASHVLAEWDSMDAARAFWNSPEYAALKSARIDNSWGEFDVFLIEGIPTPQPK